MEMIRDNSFSFIRLSMLLKREWANNRKKILMQGGILVGLMILIYMLALTFGYTEQSEYSKAFCTPMNDICANVLVFTMLIYFSIAGYISASLVCNNYATKEGKIDSLMCVGTPLEKYLVRIIIYVFGYIILFAVSLLALETVRSIYVAAAYPWYDYNSLTEVIFREEMMQIRPYILNGIIFPISAYIFNTAYYVLMSTITPTYTFIKGYVLSMAILTVTLLLFNAIIEHVMTVFYSSDAAVEAWLIFFNILLIVFSFVMHVIAYYRYKETDLQ
ncbi:MAG: hypothetical protein ACI31F_08200 [Muribaculaceae bacterium]